MTWSKLPYWLRGAIVAVVLSLVLGLIWGGIKYSTNEGRCNDIFITHCIEPGCYSSAEFCFMNILFSNPLYSLPFGLYAELILLAIYFGIGSLAGFLYGRKITK